MEGECIHVPHFARQSPEAVATTLGCSIRATMGIMTDLRERAETNPNRFGRRITHVTRVGAQLSPGPPDAP